MAGAQVTGRTENVSRSGVLVRLEGEAGLAERLLQGDFIEADIELPGRSSSLRRSLYCRGIAVWWRELEGDLVLALAVEHLRFRDLPRRHVDAESARSLVM